MKFCNGCGVEKSLEDFSRKSASKDGRQTKCKECVRDYFTGWYAENGDSVRERSASWARENPEANRERARQWNQDNTDRHRLRSKKFKHIRRALEKETSVGPIDFQQLWDDQQGVCALCTVPIDWTLEHPHTLSKSLDHIVPISRGGGHIQENVQWAHLGCNLSKGARV